MNRLDEIKARAVVVEDEDGFTNWDASVVELIERQKLLEGESNE